MSRGAVPFLVGRFVAGGSESGGRGERLAIVEQRQIAYVQRDRAGRRFRFDDHRHGTAFDALAERDAAPTSEPRVRESLHRLKSYHAPRSALISCSKVSFFDRPRCLEQTFPSREIRNVTGRPNIGP